MKSFLQRKDLRFTANASMSDKLSHFFSVMDAATVACVMMLL